MMRLLVIGFSFWALAITVGGGALAASVLPVGELWDLKSAEKAKGVVLDQSKLVLLNFWATWCTNCKYELKVQLPELSQKLGVQVVTVNIDKEEARAKHYVKKFEIALPVFQDSSGSLLKDLGVVNVPHWALYKFKAKAASSGAWELIAHQEGFDQEKISELVKTNK
ncbi:MAG: TlpA family protein disulfide reductase [Oligoflexia bacterium]|nr:TlpA family protein disulfide reductase [Oligoflexia bacterium]MBF0367302.1 TlpA family protein disulfide reductase [Oligoflexia bacterium]